MTSSLFNASGNSLTAIAQDVSAADYIYKFGMQYNGLTCSSFTTTYKGQTLGQVIIADYGGTYGHSSLAVSGFGFSNGTDLV